MNNTSTKQHTYQPNYCYTKKIELNNCNFNDHNSNNDSFNMDIVNLSLLC